MGPEPALGALTIMFGEFILGGTVEPIMVPSGPLFGTPVRTICPGMPPGAPGTPVVVLETLPGTPGWALVGIPGTPALGTCGLRFLIIESVGPGGPDMAGCMSPSYTLLTPPGLGPGACPGGPGGTCPGMLGGPWGPCGPGGAEIGPGTPPGLGPGWDTVGICPATLPAAGCFLSACFKGPHTGQSCLVQFFQ